MYPPCKEAVFHSVKWLNCRFDVKALHNIFRSMQIITFINSLAKFGKPLLYVCNRNINSKPGIDPKVPCFWKRDFVVLICCSTRETRRQLQYNFPPSGHQQEHHGEIYTAPVKRENSTEKNRNKQA